MFKNSRGYSEVGDMDKADRPHLIREHPEASMALNHMGGVGGLRIL